MIKAHIVPVVHANGFLGLCDSMKPKCWKIQEFTRLDLDFKRMDMVQVGKFLQESTRTMFQSMITVISTTTTTIIIIITDTIIVW